MAHGFQYFVLLALILIFIVLLPEFVLQQIDGQNRNIPIFMELQNLQHISNPFLKQVVDEQLVGVTGHVRASDQPIHDGDDQDEQSVVHIVGQVLDDLTQ